MATATTTSRKALIQSLGGLHYRRRHEVGSGRALLVALGAAADDFTLRLLAQGIVWADDTGRTPGTLAIALRRATGWQLAQLLLAAQAEGLTLPAEVPSWLNRRALQLLEVAS